MQQKNVTLPFTEMIELELYSYYKQLRLHGCTYMYYTVNNPHKGRLRFTTNEDWINIYLEEKMVQDDPVKLICEQNKNRIVLWKNIPLSGAKQTKVMEARESYQLYNGINVIHHDPVSGLQKILALCTDVQSHNLASEILGCSTLLKPMISNIFGIV